MGVTKRDETNKRDSILWNNQQMSQCAVKFYFSASPLYMFRAAHTPIIRSTISSNKRELGESIVLEWFLLYYCNKWAFRSRF